MLHGYFDLPTFTFFDQGNVWVGSMYTNFSYKIDFLIEEKKKTAFRLRIWFGTQSVEYVDDFVFEKEFPFTAEAYDELIGVLNEQFELFKADPTPKPSSLNI